MEFINKIYAYVDLKKDNDYVMIVIHEHFGISNYVRLMAHGLCNNEISIVIPNLFEIASGESNYDNDIDFLKNLNHANILKMIY